MSETESRASERTWVGAVSAFGTATAFVVFAGPSGLAGVALVVGAWLFVPATYAFAVGHVAVVALLPDLDLVRIALLEAGLLGVLLAPTTQLDDAIPTVTLTLGWVAFGAALAWASARSHLRLSLAVALAVGATLLAAYGVYHYQLVELEPVGDTNE